MSVLRSFSFNKVPSGDVWNLFKDAKNLGTDLDYTLEIIDNAMSGNIDTSKDFNIGAYIGKINKLKRLENNRELKKMLNITEEVSDNPHEIPDDKLPAAQDQYQKFEDDDEVLFSVEEINRISGRVLIENRLNINRCIKQALKGIPASIDALRRLVQDDDYAAELLYILLKSGYEMKDLFGFKESDRNEG